MDQNTVFLAILVIALLAVAVFASPGITGGLHSGGPLATPLTPNAEFGVIHEQKSLLRSFVGSGINTSPPLPPAKPQPTPEELLKKYVRISATGARSRDINREYIQVTLLSGADMSVNISDWTISNSRGESFRLGKVTSLYGITSYPNQDNLVLVRGGTVNIITGRSPVGENFRSNKCMGYVTQFYSFIPSVGFSCPRPSRESEQENLRDDCFAYIRNLSSCRTPQQLPLYLNNQCREYIAKTINYNGCMLNHRTDQDFYKNMWWVYLSRPLPIWSDIRETITLRNEKGIVIQSVSY